jgi:hypothetical protein
MGLNIRAVTYLFEKDAAKIVSIVIPGGSRVILNERLDSHPFIEEFEYEKESRRQKDAA